MSPKKPLHILAIRLSSLGDVLLQSSYLAWVKSEFGDRINLSLLTSSEFASIYESTPIINQIYTIDRRKKTSILELVKNIHSDKKVDFILDLHGTTRSQLIRFCLPSIKRLSVDKRSFRRKILTFFKFNTLGSTPYLERNIIDHQGIWNKTYSKSKLSLFLKKSIPKEKYLDGQISCFKQSYDLEDSQSEKFSFLDQKSICITPSASFENKRWPIEHFMELTKIILEKTPYQVIVLAGPDDDFCDQFNTIKDDRLINLQGKTSYNESALITSKAILLIGNDSGLNHIAEACGTPVIAIFGPTHEGFGFVPHLNQSKVISKSIWCRPCSTNGSKKCFRSKKYCLEEILPEEIFKNIEDSLNDSL